MTSEAAAPGPQMSLGGLELLPTAVVVLDDAFRIQYANPAAEALLETASRALIGQPFLQMFPELEALEQTVREALESRWSYSAHGVGFPRPGREPVQLACMIARCESTDAPFVVELRPIEMMLRLAREERLLSEQQVHRELIRNLAHEIRNPLGGLRGSAQLLESELTEPALREYTQVIIKEADRLQVLLDRLLTPHRAPKTGPVNIHEALERVARVVEAEFGPGIEILRDYDPSVPELHGDMEQLIQALLNVARNAAQAILGGVDGKGTILFRSRVLRQIMIARQRYRLALELQIIDDGPGVPNDIRERIFHPLVSGREGGSGIGLALAQTYVQYLGGVIECESRPGHTVFSILLPLA
jgi:two-component system, NtrC family, nitrogen regulation sensor histidine kinase GlnL